MPKITELDSVISLDGNDVLPIVSKNNNNEDETMKVALNLIGTKLLNSNEYGALNTTDKKIIGAINEVKSSAKENLSDLTDTTITTPSNADLLAYDSSTSKWVNTDLKGTASGSIATFSNGGNGIPVSEFECEIGATGFTQADILQYEENLFTSMPTATNDGITTSYDSSTGLISIKNDSRTTNFGYGSQRGIVVSGLNTSHTYKFAIYPNVLGVTLSNTGSIELDNPFTGYSTAVLRITSQYDFVNTHPIDDVTTVRLFIFDMTDGYNTTYTIPFGASFNSGNLVYKNGEWYIDDNGTITPITSSTRVKTISGLNNIYSNTGDCELKYFTDKADNIAELIKAFL